MAKKTYKANLFSVSSLKELKKDLEQYRDSLQTKCEKFVSELANDGIDIAKRSITNGFGKYVAFSQALNPEQHGCKAIILATDMAKIISQWKTKDGMKSAEVSPLLMLEFGSGKYADNPNNVSGVGQGTFPGRKHAFDEEGWYWVDENDVLHHSYGIHPQMPMYNAAMDMRKNIVKKAKEVFK